MNYVEIKTYFMYESRLFCMHNWMFEKVSPDRVCWRVWWSCVGTVVKWPKLCWGRQEPIWWDWPDPGDWQVAKIVNLKK